MTRGVKCLIKGDLPIGGLSSSASVIIGFMLTICIAGFKRIIKYSKEQPAIWRLFFSLNEKNFFNITVMLDKFAEID